MKTLFKLLCGCLIISCLSAQASVVLGGTRIIYPSNKAEVQIALKGNDSNLLIVFYVQIMPDDFVMQLHRF